MTKKKSGPAAQPSDIIQHKHATIALQNMTNMKLQVKNNKIVTFGPKKGQWALYKELIIAPHQCVTTEIFENESHQLMVYSDPQPDLFLYMIKDTDLYDKSTIQLHMDHVKFINSKAC